ncbi:MAG: c-type cytochrome domain-containing protein [Bacteroidia bacterium]|nr:c-type cytochrome domain-containing protein [Bacteroidia bacterium]
MKNLSQSFLLLMILVGMMSFQSCKHRWWGPDPEPDPIGGGGGGGSGSGDDPVGVVCDPDTVYFEQQILPLLISNCAISGCHDAQSHEEGIITTSYETLTQKSEMVRPGNPAGSKLVKVIKTKDKGDIMPPPPYSAMTSEQIALIETWISQGGKNNSCVSGCDTTTVPGYAAVIRPIIEAKCLGCHSGNNAQGGISYSNFAGVKATVDNGTLYGSIAHISGFSAMPQGGKKLPDCEITLIKMWIDDGAKNN